MSILAYVSPNHWFAIVMVPETSSQAEGGVQVPCLVARTECATQIDLSTITIVNRPPNTGFLEVLENSTEQHVVPLLLNVDTAWPIAEVQAIASESASQEFIALFTAQIPDAGSQVGSHGAGNFPIFG